MAVGHGPLKHLLLLAKAAGECQGAVLARYVVLLWWQQGLHGVRPDIHLIRNDLGASLVLDRHLGVTGARRSGVTTTAAGQQVGGSSRSNAKRGIRVSVCQAGKSREGGEVWCCTGRTEPGR